MDTQVLEKAMSCKKHSLRLEKIPVKGYEQVLKVVDETVGLTAIIAIHDTSLGPALGGIRIYPYASIHEALEDVLRLSKGMTYKSSISELGFGGGKSVIIADPKTEKTPAMLMAFGRAIEQLGGIYIGAEDVGSTPQDMHVIWQATRYVVGLPSRSGEPGIFTAWSTFRGIQATVKRVFNTSSLEGKTVAIQGVGSVGMHLAEHLFWAGAKLILSDIESVKLQMAAARFGARMVSPDQILQVECDILAPCAMGGILNDQTIPQLRCKAVAGATNNQLLKEGHADLMRERNILYAPDFVINSGGLLNVAIELEGKGYCPMHSRNRANRIYDTLEAIYEIAERNAESPHYAALALAEYRIKYGIGKRTVAPAFSLSIES